MCNIGLLLSSANVHRFDPDAEWVQYASDALSMPKYANTSFRHYVLPISIPRDAFMIHGICFDPIPGPLMLRHTGNAMVSDHLKSRASIQGDSDSCSWNS